MDLSFTVEQDMLREAVAGFLVDHYDFHQRHHALRNEPFWRPEIWKSLAEELQVLGAAFPEELGGFGGGALEHLVLMEEFGKVLLVEPYLASVVMAGGVLKHSGHARRQNLIEEIISGQKISTLAFAEHNSRYNLASVETQARQRDGAWVLNGRKKLVLSAPYCDHLIVSARTAGGAREEHGIALFLIGAQASGVSMTPYMTYDGFRAADVVLENVTIGNDALLAEDTTGFEVLSRVIDEATSAICGEAVGVLKKMLELTLNYARDRRQFGGPISGFQAIQHRMADMFINLEQAKSIALLGAIRADDPDHLTRKRGVSLAKAYIGGASKSIGQSAIQIHGGMGITDEMAISHYFKRATMIESQFGSVDTHLSRIECLD